jgi:hypothetical protein
VRPGEHELTERGQFRGPDPAGTRATVAGMSRVSALPAPAVPKEREHRAAANDRGAPRSSEQLTLFVADLRRLPALEGLSGGAGEHRPGDPEVAAIDVGQIELFAPRAVVWRELDIALVHGRFEEAARLRRLLEDNYGRSVETENLGFLERLDGRWQESPKAVLSTWIEIDAHLEPLKYLQARVRDGVFARLLQSHAAGTLADARPECLPALTHVLARRSDASDGRRRARLLIRDALLAARGLEPLDFGHDPEVADLLAEDLPPRWLACLGVIRRLWPAPPPEDAALVEFSDQPAPGGSDEHAARAFWRCLQVAEDPGAAEELRHEARRRMKRLHTELHRQYMRRAAKIANGCTSD